MDPYAAGRCAFLTGTDVDQNPHKVGTRDHINWEDGWFYEYHRA